MITQSRRNFLLSTVALATVTFSTFSFAADPILIGVPSAQSGPVGIADHQDWLNGVNLAIEEINGAGGINGRMSVVE